MRLTLEQDRETIKRYSHIKPARGWRTKLCSTMCRGTAHTCTLAKDHRGPHVAHGLFKKVIAVWDSGTEDRASGEVVSLASGGRGRSGLLTSRKVGILQSLRDRVASTVSSVDELVFLLLFLAFVAFAIQWLLLILG